MWRDVWNFVRAFGHSWTSLMSGPLSVPFAVWAVVNEGWQRVSLAVLSVLCFFVGAFVVWRAEHHRAATAEGQLDDSAAVDELASVYGAGQDLATKIKRSTDADSLESLQAEYLAWRDRLRRAAGRISEAKGVYVDGIQSVAAAVIREMRNSATREEDNARPPYLHPAK